MRASIALTALILSVTFTASADFPEMPKLGFTQLRTDWQNGSPSTLWLRWLDSKNNIQCYHFPLGAQLGVLPTGWTDIEAVQADLLAHNLIDNNLTDAQKKDCGTTKIPTSWLDQIANLPPPPTIVWKVAVNSTFTTRPMKDANFVDIKERATVGSPCEPETIKVVTTKTEWHFTKSTNGVRGLAVCSK